MSYHLAASEDKDEEFKARESSNQPVEIPGSKIIATDAVDVGPFVEQRHPGNNLDMYM